MVALTRNCEARLVPTGDPIQLVKDTFVTLTQSLGSVYTVIANGNMARVEAADADALGFEPEVLVFADAGDGKVNPDQVEQALASVFDPEIPVSVLELGLIYDRKVTPSGQVDITMTLTAPGCGMGPVLVDEIKRRVALVPNVSAVQVELVFDPPWSRDMMSEEAQLELGLF